jgi:predicted amidohydrolase
VTSLRVAIVQGESTARYENGLARTRSLAEEAARGGAELVAFPETWLPGYPAWLDLCRDVALWDHDPVKKIYARYAHYSVDARGREGQALGEIARSLGVTLVIGVSERVSEGPGRGTLYNSLLTYGPDGTLLNHHRKLMPTHTERMVWGLGDADGIHAAQVGGARIGGLICWEHWMPLARQALHESGEDVHVAAWPTAHERSQLASRHYAFEGRCYVLVAGSVMRAGALPDELEVHPGRVSDSGAWVLRGGSAIIGPDGNYLVEPRYDEACIVQATLDLDRIREEQMTLDVGGHYSRPDCLQLSVRTTGRWGGR